jgi:hypothetical protein
MKTSRFRNKDAALAMLAGHQNVSARCRFALIASVGHQWLFRGCFTHGNYASHPVPHPPGVYQQPKREGYANGRHDPKNPTRAGEARTRGRGSLGPKFI